MARLVVDGDDLVLRLSWRERLAAGRREVRVPSAAVVRADVEPDWWRCLRGTPRRGRWRPGRCLGERRHVRGRDFVAVRAGGPAVRVELGSPASWARLAVTVPGPEEVVRRIRRAAHARAAPEPASRGEAPARTG
ncbi:hypothetical protein ACFOOM_33010 [Streptomyces echinoruber]|uniref:hypothetical protein n=1 Tax=Streptomyces echinoruber TaxID=68898 RepID=UPI0036096129